MDSDLATLSDLSRLRWISKVKSITKYFRSVAILRQNLDMLFSKFGEISKLVSVIVCSVLFGFLMREIFSKYLKKTTTTGLRKEKQNSFHISN